MKRFIPYNQAAEISAKKHKPGKVTDTTIESIKKEIESNKSTMQIVIVALFIGFIILLITIGCAILEGYRFNTNFYNNLNDKIDNLSKDNTDFKFHFLEQKIENLQIQITCLRNNPNNQLICS